MRYPTLTSAACARLAKQMLEGERPSIEPHVTWVGHGADLDLTTVEIAALEICDLYEAWDSKDLDPVEGKASCLLFEALAHVPNQVLDDKGFWRYLSLEFFWDFIAWREREAFSRGNHLTYVSAEKNTEAVLPRMYLRARAVEGDVYRDLPSALTESVDFWRSHVIRVQIGTAPPLARAFVIKQRDERLKTDPVREVAKALHRTWSNIVPHVYEDDEARALIDEIWDEYRE